MNKGQAFALVQQAIDKGGKIYASVSGGKDGQAMTKVLHRAMVPVEGMIHADLGRVEWKLSHLMCEEQSEELDIPLHIIRRSDGLDLLGLWQRRMRQLEGTGKPFWSSSKNRYCTSDMKRAPIDKFLRSTGHDIVISCEGIRAEESPARAKKPQLAIREQITSSYYDGMTVEQAITNFQPGKRLALTWYPIFDFTVDQVWGVYNNTSAQLLDARIYYAGTGYVPLYWRFHPAYVYGNDRVSCMFCILGSLHDLKVGAQHNPGLLAEMVEMEKVSGHTFKHKWSLETLTN